jgi:outer membrane lipoprotein-sorting protein
MHAGGLVLTIALLAQAEDGRKTLQALADKHRDVRSLQAGYVQERRSALMEKPLVSKGTLFWRREPGCLVFDVTEPRRSRIRLDATSYQVHRPDERQAERFQFASNELARSLFQVFAPEPAKLEEALRLESYEVEEGVGTLRLRPVAERLKAFLGSLSLAVRLADTTLVRVAYTDGEGDEVRIELSDLKRNPAIDPSVFEARVPEGTRWIVHEVKDRK